MILQALKQYYDRLASADNASIAPPGWEKKEIPFIIVISSEGKAVGIEDTRETESKKKRAKTFLVPQAVKRSSGINANFLWDTSEYALGCVCKTKADRVMEMHSDFIKKVKMSAGKAQILQPLLKFLESSDKCSVLEKFPEWGEIKNEKQSPFISFKLQGCNTLICEDKEIIDLISNSAADKESDNIRCLISGELEPLQNLHTSIKGVWGTQTTGGNIVSFNNDAFCSFGKKQGANAAIGIRSAFAYTTALNELLAKDSRKKLLVGETTIVFWAAEENLMEEDFFDLFTDRISADTEKVKNLYQSAENGAFVSDNDQTPFFVLGLAPNAARIAIRFWEHGTVADFAHKFRTYFEDLSIVHSSSQPEHLPLWKLLSATAAGGESKNIAPNLAGNIMRSILTGLPFPETLLMAAIQRIKADHMISYPRAKLIKGFINRKLRFSNPENERSLTMSLDVENQNTGYRLGRLFAVLEEIQQKANPGINTTVRERFYASASAAPVTVFPNLLRLKQHHLGKLKAPHYFENIIENIMSGISSFPAHLSLNDQGMFAIGYYHQKNAMYVFKETDN